MVTEGSKACRGTLHPLLPAEAVDRQELRMQLGPPHVHLQQRGRVFEKRPERRPFVVKLLIAKKLEPTPPHPPPQGAYQPGAGWVFATNGVDANTHPTPGQH
jgi:hypothetical protein